MNGDALGQRERRRRVAQDVQRPGRDRRLPSGAGEPLGQALRVDRPAELVAEHEVAVLVRRHPARSRSSSWPRGGRSAPPPSRYRARSCAGDVRYLGGPKLPPPTVGSSCWLTASRAASGSSARQVTPASSPRRIPVVAASRQRTPVRSPRHGRGSGPPRSPSTPRPRLLRSGGSVSRATLRVDPSPAFAVAYSARPIRCSAGAGAGSPHSLPTGSAVVSVGGPAKKTVGARAARQTNPLCLSRVAFA